MLILLHLGYLLQPDNWLRLAIDVTHTHTPSKTTYGTHLMETNPPCMVATQFACVVDRLDEASA